MLSDLNSESSPVRGQDLKSNSFSPNQAKTSSQLDLEAEFEDQESPNLTNQSFYSSDEEPPRDVSSGRRTLAPIVYDQDDKQVPVSFWKITEKYRSEICRKCLGTSWKIPTKFQGIL